LLTRLFAEAPVDKKGEEKKKTEAGEAEAEMDIE
jgi:hypothetical protein